MMMVMARQILWVIASSADLSQGTLTSQRDHEVQKPKNKFNILNIL